MIKHLISSISVQEQFTSTGEAARYQIRSKDGTFIYLSIDCLGH